MLLATRVAATENMADTWALLETAMTRHGRPAMLLHDGSIAFSGVRQGRGQVTDLQWQLRRLGIHQIVSLAPPPANLRQEGTRLAAPAPLARRPPRRREQHRPATPGRRLRRGVQHRTPPPGHRPGHPRTALPGHRQGHTRTTGSASTPDIPGRVTAGRTGRVPLGPGGHSITLGHAWTGTTLTVLRHDLDAVIFHGPHLIRRIRINPHLKIQPSGLTPGRPPRSEVPSAMS